MRVWSSLVLLTACSATVGTRGGVDDDRDAGEVADTPPDAGLRLEDREGRYRGSCDASGAVALDFTRVLAFSDEDQLLRSYDRGTAGPPQQAVDIAAALGLATGEEADFEDAERAGDRVFVITSHARRRSGDLDPRRQRLLALDVAGMTVAGASSRLLDDLVDAARWDAAPAILDALVAATRLDLPNATTLAPEQAGLNIEGLARAPLPDAPERMVIGLRNPRPSGRAIVVSLMNASAVIAGAPARFGEATELDLVGLGIRGLTWSDALQTVLVLAGPHDAAAGPFRLYRWSGAPGAPAVFIRDLVVPADMQAETIVAYPGTADVQILFDADASRIGGTTCKDAPVADREFRDLIVHL